MSPIRRLFVVLVVVVVGSLCSNSAWGDPVRGFVDKGVIHITNEGKPGPKGDTKSGEEPASGKALNPTTIQEVPVAAPPEKVEVPSSSPGQDNPSPKPPSQVEKPPASSGEDHPERPLSVKGIQAPDPASPEADPFLSPVRYVAGRKPGPGPQVTARATQSRSGGDILVYRDRKGVLHIENSGVARLPETPALLPGGQGQMAAIRPISQEEAPQAPPPPGTLPSWQQVARPSQPLLPRPSRDLLVPKAIARLEPETIRCYRDTRGVLHVTNEGAPGLANGPPAQGGGVGQGVTLTSYHSGIREGPGLPETSRPPPNAAKVVVGRDRQGRLTIYSMNPETRVAPGPLPQTLAGLEPIIAEASRSYGLPVPLILALIKVESNFVPQAVSPKGAMGLMQLMPGTADSLGVKDAFCPRENVMAGCRHLRWLLNTFNGSLPLGLAAYNAGFQRVINAGFRMPEIKETQDFVTKVLEGYQELISGGRLALRF